MGMIIEHQAQAGQQPACNAPQPALGTAATTAPRAKAAATSAPRATTAATTTISRAAALQYRIQEQQ